ncbi:MAG: CRISPR-associated protein [bacterium]|nr:MAG: CRISPR-associated protein [bacterium]
MGNQLPADHGYALYSSICKHLPTLHNSEWGKSIAVELISGRPLGQGRILLPNRGANFSLRLPSSHCGQVLPLAGKRLKIGQDQITIGIPSIQLFSPSSNLYSRTVIIKKFTEPEGFLAAAYQQLETLGITAQLEIPLDEQGRFQRRVMRIRDHTVVGFSLAAHNLSDEDSLKLQTIGLGGRRHMGCGIFNPIVNLTPK